MRTILLALFISLAFNASATDSTFFFTTSDNVRLYVRVAGKGTPCVFVHGGPGSTSYYLEGMTAGKLLEKKVQMIYYDQRGSGRSDSALNNDYSAARFSNDLDEIREYLGISKWHVMGHSFAGFILTDYALRYPSRISSLLYINATMNIRASMQGHLDFGIKELGLQNDTSLTNTSVPVEQRVWKVHQMLTEKDIWYRLMYRNAYEKHFNDSVTMLIGKFNRDFAGKVWSIPDYTKDLTIETPSIKLPVFIMTGDQDYAIGTEHYRAFRFPNRKIVHYIGGHAPFQEEPQWFSEKVLDWLLKK